MKLKTLKPHYYERIFRVKNAIYFADKLHSERAVRNGLCEEIKLPTRKDKIEDKQHPKTKKKAIETKAKKRKTTKKATSKK